MEQNTQHIGVIRIKSDGEIVIYSRKSKFTGKGESIENQIEMCRQYIRIQFGEAAADNVLVFEDEGFSGGTLERPQFKKMMAEAKEKNFRAVVVYRLDRISRNIGDFARLIEQLNGMKIDFISIKEQFDTSSPLGRAMMYISSVFSQLERETIAERIRDNMHELAKTGRWLGGVAPTGYESESVTNVTVDGKVKKACKLKIIPEEIGVVKLIFDEFLETGSLTKTETYLLQNQYTTKNGKRFTRFAVKGILTNPVYLIADELAWRYLTKNHVDLFSDKSEFDSVHGIMAYNRTLQKPGKAHQIRPMEEWIVSVGKHEGVIEGEAWVKVQTLLEQNRSKSSRRRRSTEKGVIRNRQVCIANEILMHFRSQRKLQGEVSLTDTLEAAGDGGTLSLMDVIAVDDNMLEDLDTRDACVKVRQCVKTCLTPRERMIITLRYGLDDKPPRTQREIAAQCGISRSYVSRHA